MSNHYLRMVKRKSEKIVVVAALETYAMMVSNIIWVQF